MKANATVCLVLGHPLCSSPTPGPESRKNQEIPRLLETSVKDRLAKYQAAVSKQGSSSSQLVGSSLFSPPKSLAVAFPEHSASEMFLMKTGLLKGRL